MNQQQILDEIVTACELGGKYLIAGQKALGKLAIIEKSANQLVSKIDIETEKILVKHLAKAFPSAGFITEESTVAATENELHFIIDPLDGTTNYLHGLGLYSISVAAVYKNELIAGVVYIPTTNELFTAVKGNGAFLNGEKISVSQSAALKDSLLATGFPYYNFEGKTAYIAALDHFMQNTRGLRRMGSAAIDLAYTACGRFCGFFELHLQTWDVAAGILLVQEAGGIVSDFNGEIGDRSGKEIMASNKNLYPAFKAVLADSFHNAPLA